MLHALTALASFAFPPLQDPAPERYVLEDADVWGESVLCGPKPDARPADPPPPILVGEWRVLRGGAAEAEQALGRYLLDPDGFDPTGWEELDHASKSSKVAAAVASVHVDEDQVRMARLSGARCLAIRGELFLGDPERMGHGGVPVAMRVGRNELLVFEASEGFELELWAPRIRAVVADWWIELPRVTREVDTWDWHLMHVPVFNASVERIAVLHLHYGDAVPDQDGRRPHLSAWADGGGIAPLVMTVEMPIFEPEPRLGLEIVTATNALFPLCVYGSGDTDADRRILRIPLAEPGTMLADRGDVDAAKPATAAEAWERAGHLVYGTLGSEAETQALLARARFDQQRIMYMTGHVAEVVDDRSFHEEPYVRRRPAVLYGNQDTNSAWQWLMGDAADLRVRRGSARLGEGPTREGADLFGFTQRSRTDAEGVEYLVLALFDTGADGTRRGAQLDPRNLTSDAREGYCDPDVLQPR